MSPRANIIVIANTSTKDSQGKGILGCMASIFLLGAAIFLAIELGPIYYSNHDFEKDVQTEANLVGTRLLDNETVIKDILNMAANKNIRLKKENIKVERFAGQIHITVDYAVPVDYAVFKRDLNFQITVSSFIRTQ